MLTIALQLPLKTENAGLFVSRGKGTHPTRRISSHELIFVRSGVLRMFEEKQSFVLPKNSYLLLYPGRLHGGAADYPPDLSFYWIHFVFPGISPGSSGADDTPARPPVRSGAGGEVVPPRRRNGGPASVRAEPVSFRETEGRVRLAIPQTGVVGSPERLVELYRQFLADQESGDQNAARAALQMLAMLELLADSGRGRPAAPVPALVTRVDCLLTQEGHTGIRTAGIARRLHCNPDYLGRLYKRHRGMTLTEALLRRRMNEAQRRLLDSAENIGEIARACGFGEIKYFRKLFKTAKGITPSAYRRQYTRVHYNTE